MKKVIFDLDVLEGHLRCGHIECEMEESLIEQLQSDPKSEALQDYVDRHGTIFVDDFKVYDYEFSGDYRIV